MTEVAADDLMSDQERINAFDLGAQFAAVQARSLKELQTLIRTEQAARIQAETKLAEETLLWRTALEDTLKMLTESTRQNGQRLNDEVTARKELEQNVVEERTQRTLLRHRLNEEEEARLMLERRLKEEEEAGALLKSRLEENIQARNALEARVEHLEATCNFLNGEGKQQVSDRITGCENEGAEIKTLLGMARKDRDAAEFTINDKLEKLERGRLDLLDKLETFEAVNKTDKDKRSNEESAAREALRTLMVEKDYLAHKRMDEMAVNAGTETRRLDTRVDTEKEARTLLSEACGRQRQESRDAKQALDATAGKVATLEGHVAQYLAWQKSSEVSIRQLANLCISENNIVVMKEVEMLKERVEEEGTHRKVLTAKVEDEIQTRQRLTNTVNTESAALQLLQDRMNRSKLM